ncbi:fungal trichothecene efflux pump [Leptodontidium sp. 2 PMI_412]|nr:fungal trichothecene efflux pump [Leptodontidium sp. MPI-SDFR-AT-0119]KAH9211086.1 fungal trichothecene efflux pump [Leptodontidium sp. 2 PMI_412]
MAQEADEKNGISEKHVENSSHNDYDRHVAIHTDTFDIDEDALGINLPKNYYMSPGFIGTVIALCLGNISNYLGWVVPSNSLLLINEDIGPSKNITWVALAYTLGLSVGFLVVGRLSDIFGRRWFFIIGNSFALIGAIVSATATHVESIIGGNLLGGLAGAVQISFTVAIAELVPNKHRPLWLSAIFFSSFEIACFGPVIAQSLVTGTKAGWRWSFYLDIIVAGLAVILFFFFYHPPNFHLLHKNRSRMEQLKRMDFVGLVLFCGGLSVFLIGLAWAGTVYPWKSAHVIATIVVGAVVLIIFVLYDAYIHPGDTLLPLHLFKSRGYLAMVITAMVGSCVYYSMNVLWPQQIGYLFPGTTTHNGWLACIVGSATLIGQMVGGVLCRYVPRSRLILIISCVSLTAFSAAMVSVGPGDETKGIALMFMACFSVGIIETCSLALAPLACASEDLGAALGALGSIRSGGASVATAIYTTILSNKLGKFIPALVTTAALDAGLPSSSLPELFANLSTGTLSAVPGINPNIISAVVAANAEAASKSFQYVWYAVIAFGALAVVAACLTIDYGVYLTDEVARKMHGATVGEKEEQGDEK